MNSTIDISVNHALVGVFALGLLVGFGAGAVSPIQIGEDTEKPSEKTDTNFTAEGEPILGQEDAPVTIYAFEEFQCPFCKKFEEGAFQKISSNYVESGKVRVVWKDYPLPPKMHPWAGKSAVQMECVYRQDEEAFWNVKKRIFDNQRSLTVDNIDDRIQGWAAQEGVSKSAIQQCAKQDNVRQEINQDMQEGGRLGTPTLFIGKTGSSDFTKISGAQPYSVFKNAIENKLNS
jgi:protein-disulfide isomerase